MAARHEARASVLGRKIIQQPQAVDEHREAQQRFGHRAQRIIDVEGNVVGAGIDQVGGQRILRYHLDPADARNRARPYGGWVASR